MSYQWMRDNQATQNLLRLACNRIVMLSVIEQWTDEQCQQAEKWAGAVHFRASDNNIKSPTMPDHVAACPQRAAGAFDADLMHL